LCSVEVSGSFYAAHSSGLRTRILTEEIVTDRELKCLTELIGNCGYNDANKSKFRALSTKLLRTLAHELAITAEVRYNPGGIAIGGEAVLHSEDIYVMISADTELGILHRICRGKNDFTGGQNRWMSWSDLLDGGVQCFASRIQKLRAKRRFNQVAIFPEKIIQR
jgi:hypothetical protein